MNEIGCSGCLFFSEFPKDMSNNASYTIGQCRFRAPETHHTPDRVRTVWPVVRSTDFCGEHAVKEPCDV